MGQKKQKLAPMTEDEKKFSDLILDGKSPAEAAMIVFGYGEDERGLAAAKALSVLRKDKTIEYFEAISMKAAKRINKLAEGAMNESVQLSANKEILDRAGIGIQKGTVVPIQINIEEERKEYGWYDRDK